MQSLIDQIRQLRAEIAQNETRPSAEEICARLDLLAAEAEELALETWKSSVLIPPSGRMNG